MEEDNCSEIEEKQSEEELRNSAKITISNLNSVVDSYDDISGRTSVNMRERKEPV